MIIQFNINLEDRIDTHNEFLEDKLKLRLEALEDVIHIACPQILITKRWYTYRCTRI